MWLHPRECDDIENGGKSFAQNHRAWQTVRRARRSRFSTPFHRCDPKVLETWVDGAGGRFNTSGTVPPVPEVRPGAVLPFAGVCCNGEGSVETMFQTIRIHGGWAKTRPVREQDIWKTLRAADIDFSFLSDHWAVFAEPNAKSNPRSRTGLWAP